MQGALTQEYLESFEEAQHSRRRSGPQNCVANFQDITLADTIASEIVRERLRGGASVAAPRPAVASDQRADSHSSMCLAHREVSANSIVFMEGSPLPGEYGYGK